MAALSNVSTLKVLVASYSISNQSDIHIPGYRVRRLKTFYYQLKYGFSVNFMTGFCMSHDIDILHIQQSYLFPKALNLLQLHKRNSNTKLVITFRGGDTYVKPWYSKKWSDFYRNYGDKIDALIVMSEHQKNYMHEKWHIKNERIHVIPISYGHPFLNEPKVCNPNQLRVSSAFRMCWEKNINSNLQTISYLKFKGVPVHYDIYGDGPDLGQLYYLIDKLKIKDCVNIHGRVANEILISALKKSDFILHLSLSESLGMSVIEAQTLGLPAIVSDTGGLPEIIKHNESGYCVPPNDYEQAALKLELLWKNPSMYQDFSNNAIQHAQTNFSIEMETEKLSSLYVQLNHEN